MKNLDLECAGLAEELAQDANKDREKLLTDSLGVLQEQGLYAFFLFLKANKRGKDVSDACHTFLRDHGLLKGGSNDLFPALKSLADRLDDLLLARDLLIQALVYARYHVRARIKGAS